MLLGGVIGTSGHGIMSSHFTRKGGAGAGVADTSFQTLRPSG